MGPQQVKEAAKEAVQGVGFDVLVVCGFAFDPHVSEEAKRYGKLTVLVTRMNPDLSMGDDLLKKTGAGNLFMVFGEPDIKVTTEGVDGNLTVEVRGVDVYDPTTGQIGSSSTDDIACWFIDTDYNGESFFVRHAYFTGGDEPYEKLKRALRADIDEGAWSTLYSTTSRPFAPPETGKIAVKVINHYGDEVLKVFGGKGNKGVRKRNPPFGVVSSPLPKIQDRHPPHKNPDRWRQIGPTHQCRNTNHSPGRLSPGPPAVPVRGGGVVVLVAELRPAKCCC